MRTQTLTRYLLQDSDGVGRMNVYLDSSSLTPNHVITLDGIAGEWTVLRTYETIRAESVKSHRIWGSTDI